MQKHFDELNKLVEDGTISIKNDLSIEDHSIALYSTYGKWTIHWWGYDRKFNNSQTNQFVVYLDTVGEGASVITGTFLWLPSISSISLATSAYLTLMSQRINANNRGRGVYVGITWASIFNIRAL